MPERFELITSLQNPRLKHLVRLREARRRRRAGFFLIEGERELRRALAAKWPVQEIFFAPELFSSPDAFSVVETAVEAGAGGCRLSPEAFAKVAYRQGPDGLLGLAPSRERKLDALQPPSSPLLIVVEGVEKPGNLGALVRTANAAGADGLILCDPRCDPYNPNAIRASQGALFDLPLATDSVPAVQQWLAARAIPWVATTPRASRLLWEHDLRGPLALVLGAEDVGLSQGWLEDTGRCARLPMSGLTDSLNLSVTAGIALFEAVRQRRVGPPN